MSDRRDDDLRQSADEQQRLRQLENDIARLTAELEKLDAALARYAVRVALTGAPDRLKTASGLRSGPARCRPWRLN